MRIDSLVQLVQIEGGIFLRLSTAEKDLERKPDDSPSQRHFSLRTIPASAGGHVRLNAVIVANATKAIVHLSDSKGSGTRICSPLPMSVDLAFFVVPCPGVIMFYDSLLVYTQG